MKTDEKPDKKTKYDYFLDGTKRESEISSISGAAIRAHLPAEKAGYAIYLESHGNDPDQLVNDGDRFSLEKNPLKFYSVPPANFGSK